MAGNEKTKGKLGVYWGAACGGCDITIANIHENILAVDAAFDIALWPCLADFKYEHVENYPDGYMDICLFNGAIRSSENEEMAHLLRRKSKVLVAFGSCAHEGCIPALSNLTSREATFKTVFHDSPSVDNPGKKVPQPMTRMPEGELKIPTFYNTVKSLHQVVPVDYTIPGCPPESKQVWAVLETVINGGPLPPPGSILGAGKVAVCEECPLTKSEKSIERFFRPYEIIPKPDVCLLEQGLVCLGAGTRAGCGALCPQVGMGCRSCYGPLDGVEDQGAKLVAAIGSAVGVGKSGEEEAELEKKIEAAMDTLADPAGTFYRFSMANSFLHRARTKDLRAGQGEAS